MQKSFHVGQVIDTSLLPMCHKLYPSSNYKRGDLLVVISIEQKTFAISLEVMTPFGIKKVLAYNESVAL